MSIAREKHTSLFLLAILLGAIFTVLCMGMSAHAVPHTSHFHHTESAVTCAQAEVPASGCTFGHGLLIHTLTQASPVTVVLAFIFLVVVVLTVGSLLLVRDRVVGKQFYKTRWRLTRLIHAVHILRWFAMLQKQDSYIGAAA